MRETKKLFGLPLNDEVTTQLKYRVQDQIPKKDASFVDTRIAHNAGSWVRCVSGVDTVDEDSKKYVAALMKYSKDPSYAKALRDWYSSTDRSSNLLASTFILSGGTGYFRIKDGEQKEYRTSGIDIKSIDDLASKSSYKFSEVGGYVPMAGITNFKVKSKSQFGTLREIELNITAHSPEQLDQLEKLFFRPGYTMLVEWGNNLYRDIEGEESSTPNTVTTAFLANIKTEKVQAKINKKIEASGLNYDAVIGKVVNFSWQYGGNGTYECSLKVIGKGEVLESVSSTFYDPDKKIKAYVNKVEDEDAPEDTNDLLLNRLKAFLNPDNKTVEAYINEYYPNGKLWVFKGDEQTGNKTENEKTGSTPGLRNRYLTLRDVLYVINKTILEKPFSGNNDSTFSTEFGTSEFTTWGTNLSANPFICGIPATGDQKITPTREYAPLFWMLSDNNQNLHFPKELSTAYVKTPELHKKVNDNDPLRILVNIEHLISLHRASIETRIKTKKEEPVFKLIKSLLRDISVAVGGQTSLDLHLFSDINKWTVIDRTNYSPVKTSKEMPIINVVGLGSLVTSLSIDSKISSNMVNMLSIAASSVGLQQQDQDGLMQYNKDLVDRYFQIPDKADSIMKEVVKSDRKLASDIARVVRNAYKIYSVDRSADKSTFDSLSYDYQKLAELTVKKIVADEREKKPVPPSDPLLPIELSLTMRGIAGIKMGEAFTVNKEILPTRYHERVGFVITGLDHVIGTNNIWYTNIKTNMLILPVKDRKPPPVVIPPLELEAVELDEVVITSTKKSDTPEADKLRAAINAAKFIEKGEELSNGGDITASASKLGVSVINTVKSELPGVKLRFTGGNDEYHQNLNSNSRHKKGNALDFTIVPYTINNYERVLKVVQGYAAGMSGQVRYKDEYKKLTVNASGAHMHISWGQGTEGNAELKVANRLAALNKINKYTV